MNRYSRGPTVGGPSKATATTTCQKCLKKDKHVDIYPKCNADFVIRHYSYECKAVVQERPYVSRPSRTQQLMNPKLVPKLTSDIPQERLRKKGVADEQLAKAELERGRKRGRQSEELEVPSSSKRMRSTSSGSVSTISTGISRSPSPELDRDTRTRRPRSPSRSRSPPRRDSFRQSRRLTSSRSPPSHPTLTDSERKRRRNSVSSMDSYSSVDERHGARDSSRSTRRRLNQTSPPVRGRRTESRSPYRGRRPLSNDRQNRGQDWSHNAKGRGDLQENEAPPRQKERSLSPFSKRLALTQSMNMGR